MKRDYWKIIGRALKMSFHVKSIPSRIIWFCSIPAAFLPVLLAKRLQLFTDDLLSLQYGNAGVESCFRGFLLIIGLFFLQICMKALQDYMLVEDEINSQYYLKKMLHTCKCEVKYPYIENDDRFQERLEMVNRFAGDNAIKSISVISQVMSMLITFASILTVLWEINPFIVVTILLTALPAAWITYKQNDESFYWNMYWSEKGAMIIHYYGILAEEKHMNEVRHFGLYPYLLARWHGFADEYSKEKRGLLIRHTGMNLAAEVLRNIVYVIVLSLTAWQIYQNPALGLGLFTLVFSLTGQMQNAAFLLFTGIAGFFSTIPNMKEFFYLQDLPKEEDGSDHTVLPGGDIEYRHVSFAYPASGRNALTDINVKIRNGEKIAIVGDNGSGKTTFINLLCGMLQPAEGEIRVGGVDATKETGRVRNSISVVFQDFARYEDTLRNNITVSDPDDSKRKDELLQLLDEMHLTGMIEQQKLGLDTPIGSFSENSNSLSGGQWQKIALARAAYRNQGHVMILDEPTSALDPIAEAQLYQDFAKLTGDKTTLLISHRLGITSVVDRILVFHDGRIIEDGTHASLMKKNGYYAKMYRAQAKWYMES